MVIQGVDEGDETPGLRLGLEVHHGDVADKHCVEHLGHLGVVVGPQGALAQLGKRAVGNGTTYLFMENK